MRLGIAGLLPPTLAEFNGAALLRVRDYGFKGAAWNPRTPPSDILIARAREIGRMFNDEGVDLAELGQYQTCLVHPEEAVRVQEIENLRQALRVARALGCPAVITGAGSLNPKGQWFSHPGNHSQGTRDRLISALREVVGTAENEGVFLALECHTNTALKDAPTAYAIIEEVASKALKVHLDPVNWMTLETVFDSGTAINRMFDLLGPFTYGAHSKGVIVEDKLIIHLSETYTGAEGDLLDHATFVRRLAALPGNPYLVIEHIPISAIPAAREHLLQAASMVGVSFT